MRLRPQNKGRFIPQEVGRLQGQFGGSEGPAQEKSRTCEQVRLGSDIENQGQQGRPRYVAGDSATIAFNGPNAGGPPLPSSMLTLLPEARVLPGPREPPLGLLPPPQPEHTSPEHKSEDGKSGDGTSSDGTSEDGTFWERTSSEHTSSVGRSGARRSSERTSSDGTSGDGTSAGHTSSEHTSPGRTSSEHTSEDGMFEDGTSEDDRSEDDK